MKEIVSGIRLERDEYLALLRLAEARGYRTSTGRVNVSRAIREALALYLQSSEAEPARAEPTARRWP